MHLSFFVLISIVCGLGWLLAYKGANSLSDLRAQADDGQEQGRRRQRRLADEKYDEIKRIKDLLGTKFEDVGDRRQQSQHRRRATCSSTCENYGKGGRDPTYQRLDRQAEPASCAMHDRARDQLQEKLQPSMPSSNNSERAECGELDAEKKARDAADKGKTDADNKHKEELPRKTPTLPNCESAITTRSSEHRRIQERVRKSRSKTSIIAIASLVNHQQETVRRAGRKDSPSASKFPMAKSAGSIPSARRSGSAWAKPTALSRARRSAFIARRTAASGRGTTKGAVGGEDIKGSIEVTRVLEAHLSEARILTKTSITPMAKGDPIYSPLWSPGHGEAFSVIGIIDLDGDGKDDRDLFDESVQTAGGTIDNDVDPTGSLARQRQGSR